MNLINKWAQIINEDFTSENPDDFKDEKNTIAADKYEQLQKEIEEVNKEFEKNSKKDVLKEEEDDDYEEDPEIEKLVKGVDKTISDLENKQSRNDRIASGETSFDDEKKDIEEQNKRYFVLKKQEVYIPGNAKTNINSEEDMENLKEGEYELDVLETKAFDTEEEAKRFVGKEIGDFDRKYNAPVEKYLPIHQKVTVPISNTRTYQADGLPKSIKRADDNAIGFLYTRTEGEGKKSEGVWNRPNEMKINNDNIENAEKIIFSEFIIYKSSTPAIFDGGIEDLAEAIMEATIPGYKEEKKRLEQKRLEYQKSLEGIVSMQKELSQTLKETLANEIEKLIAKMETEDMEKSLKEFFPDKTSDEIENLSAEDFVEFTVPKLKKILKKLGKKVEDDDSDEEEEGNAEDYATTAKDTKIDSDDELEDIIKKASVDGYSTRGDETKAERENRKDAEEKEKEEEKDEESNKKADKREADADDYEGSQDDTGSVTGNMMNGKEYKKEDSKLSMFGVPVTQKFMSYIQQKLDKKDWPKNAEEVKKMKKTVNKEWSE